MRISAHPRQLLSKMKSIVLLLLVPFLSHLAAGQQASPTQDPCEGKPISQRQLEDCAASLYKEADVHLNKVYRKLVQYMTDDLTRAQKRGDQKEIEFEETAIASLREAERAWISYRDIQCKAAAQQYEGGTAAPMIYSQCLTTLTEHRIADLKSIYEEGDRKLD